MEHKLILGGEQYLPFARSRIKAMRANGAQYASQQFEIDGCSVKIRVDGQHDYITILGGGVAYMETGQLGWSIPGEYNPTRYDAGTWDFLGVPPSAKFLGKIDTSLVSMGKQRNNPALYDGMPSIAVGPPTYTYQPGDAPDAAEQLKSSHGERTVARKRMEVGIPPSFFSGKMRLFIQAKYGAPQEDNKLEQGLFGLVYIDKGVEVHLGVRPDRSPGIYTADDGSYWLIILRLYPDAVSPTAYKLLPSAATAGMVNQLRKVRAGKISMGEKEVSQLEAYIFAGCEIDVMHPHIMDSGIALNGWPFAYGWKWSISGRKASIVTHALQLQGIKERWQAMTLHYTFTIAKDESTGEYTFKTESERIIHGQWTDGWPINTIFAPTDGLTSAPLQLQSVKLDPVTRDADFDFAVDVYGYYKGETWTPIRITRHTPLGPFPIIKQTSTGLEYPVGTDMNRENVYLYGYCPATQGNTAEISAYYDQTTMNISFGEFSYLSEWGHGSHVQHKKTVVAGATVRNVVDFNSHVVGGGPFNAPLPPGYASTYNHNFDPNYVFNPSEPYVGERGYVTLCTVTRSSVAWVGDLRATWSLLIPGGDCDAAYISTYRYAVVSEAGLAITWYGNPGVCGFSGWAGSFTPYAGAGEYNSYYGFGGLNYWEYGGEISNSEITINAFSQAVHGLAGTLANPSGGWQMYACTSEHPFYDVGMWIYTSYGKQYVMSEGLKSYPTIDFSHRFTGWA